MGLDVLSPALEHAARLSTIQEVVEPVRRPEGVGHAVNIPSDQIENLLRACHAEPSLQIFDDNYRRLANWTDHVDFLNLIYWLVGRALTSGGSEQAAADLQRYIDAERIPFTSVVLVAGLGTKQTIDLGYGIRVQPYDDAVAGPLTMGMVVRHTIGTPIQRSVLTRESSILRDHVPATVGMPESDPVPNEQFEMLVDAAMVLTLVDAELAPVPLATWHHIPSWVPCGGQTSGIGAYPPAEVPSTMTELDEEQIQRARELVGKYLHMKKARRESLRVPIDRLNRAKRRHQLVDQAIDLGVALESLFGNDSAEGDLTYRLQLRAARFLRTSLVDRKKISALVKDLYWARSRAIHSGVLPDRIREDDSAPTCSQCLREGIPVVMEGIEKVIIEGKRPEWLELLLEP